MFNKFDAKDSLTQGKQSIKETAFWKMGDFTSFFNCKFYK